jgi:hypothetical protein
MPALDHEGSQRQASLRGRIAVSGLQIAQFAGCFVWSALGNGSMCLTNLAYLEAFR